MSLGVMIEKTNFQYKEKWPLLLNLVILWSLVIILYLFSLELNHGHFGYILDDAYIHMAMAKHLTLDGVWGITKYSFSSSTSSIFWVFLLSFINYFIGVNELTPLMMNIIFSSATLILIYYIFIKCKFPSWYNFVILLLITLTIPLPTLIFTGMEHSMQIFLSIAFVYLSAKILSGSNHTNKSNHKKRDYALILILGVLLVLTRYESLFLIGVTSILFFLRKKRLYAVLLLIFSILPVMIYGFISTNQGWLFIPNSLIIKSFFFSSKTVVFSLLTIERIINLLIYNLENVVLTILLLCSVVLFIKNKNNIWDFKNILLIIFLSTLIFNLFTLSPNVSINTVFFWAFRYDAYIVALGIFVLAIALKQFIPSNTALKSNFSKKSGKNNNSLYLIIVIIVILLFSFGSRGCFMESTPQATNNIYEQQYQMGLFVNEYYNGDNIIINDIGAVNYLTDVKCLDLFGLGSMETVSMNKYGFNNNTISQLAHEKNVKIAIIYSRVFEDCIPNSWIKVGEWEIKNNTVSLDKVVSFYATSPDEATKLNLNLKNFSSRLPSDVIQRGEYMNS